MRSLLASLALLIVLAGCTPSTATPSVDTPATPTAAANPDPNHTHADFAVFINGQQVNFGQDKYMSEHLHNDDPSIPHGDLDLKAEYLHLHDGVGTVAHRHKPGLTIGEFFATLGWTWRDGCFVTDEGDEVCDGDTARWQMFVNGTEQKPFDLAYAFADLDHILLTYGATTEQISTQLATLTDDACIYSKTCPERGPAPAENCIADPDVPCVVPTSPIK